MQLSLDGDESWVYYIMRIGLRGDVYAHFQVDTHVRTQASSATAWTCSCALGHVVTSSGIVKYGIFPLQAPQSYEVPQEVLRCLLRGLRGI